MSCFGVPVVRKTGWSFEKFGVVGAWLTCMMVSLRPRFLQSGSASPVAIATRVPRVCEMFRRQDYWVMSALSEELHRVTRRCSHFTDALLRRPSNGNCEGEHDPANVACWMGVDVAVSRLSARLDVLKL